MFAEEILATVRGHCSVQTGELRGLCRKCRRVQTDFESVFGSRDDLLSLLEDDEMQSIRG